MPLKDILDRNATRAKRTYPHHAGKAKGAAPLLRTARPLPLIGPACPDLGERLPGQPCGSPLLRCNRFGDITTRFTPCKDAQRCCVSCDYNPANKQAPAATTGAGVVIGSYKWPELVDLQCRVIRSTCGPVPILVSSDHPESNPALAAICASHPDVTLWPNPERIGHTGGDIAVYSKGVVWGASRGLAVVAKLSQRFIITKPNWLADGAAELLASGLPVATRTCRGTSRWPLRAEAALLDVKQWNSPAVLDRIRPRRYWTDSPQGLSAETVIARVLEDLLGGIFWPWSLFTEERRRRVDGVVWHNSDTERTYRELAAKHGVTLPADFHTDGWEHELRKGEYLYG